MGQKWHVDVLAGITFLIMVFLLLTPLGIITANFLMIPPLILYVRLDLIPFFLAASLIFLILLLVGGAWGPILAMIALFFFIPGSLMGYIYKRKDNALMATAFGFVTLLGLLLASIVAMHLMGFQLDRAIANSIREGFGALPPEMAGVWTEETIEQTIQNATMLIPLYVILFAMYYTSVSHWLGRKMLQLAGNSIAGFPPAKDWMLPKSLVWYYLAAIAADIMMPRQDDSIWTMIVANSLPLLTILFCVQGLSFLFFMAAQKNWGKWVPYLGLFPLLLAPNLFSLLGVFDVAFPLRKRLRSMD